MKVKFLKTEPGRMAETVDGTPVAIQAGQSADVVEGAALVLCKCGLAVEEPKAPAAVEPVPAPKKKKEGAK